MAEGAGTPMHPSEVPATDWPPTHSGETVMPEFLFPFQGNLIQLSGQGKTAQVIILSFSCRLPKEQRLCSWDGQRTQPCRVLWLVTRGGVCLATDGYLLQLWAPMARTEVRLCLLAERPWQGTPGWHQGADETYW